MKIVVGSENPAKLKAARLAVNKLFPGAKVSGVKVDSGVDRQPKSDQEAIGGAVNRARIAAQKTKADFFIGMEGGINKIGKRWFECGWVVVVDKKGKVGLGSSGRYELSEKISRQLFSGKELAEVMNSLTGRDDVNLTEGAMGVLTNKKLTRPIAYAHGIIFAFARFISDPKFW